jgi:hypothetical protein
MASNNRRLTLILAATVALAALLVALLRSGGPPRPEGPAEGPGSAAPAGGADRRDAPPRRPAPSAPELDPRSASTSRPGSAAPVPTGSTLAPAPAALRARLAPLQRHAARLARAAALRKRLRVLDVELSRATPNERQRLDLQRRQLASALAKLEAILSKTRSLPTVDPAAKGKKKRSMHHIRKAAPLQRP